MKCYRLVSLLGERIVRGITRNMQKYCTTAHQAKQKGRKNVGFRLSSVIFIDKQISVERQPLQCRINAEQLACDACSTRNPTPCARAGFCTWQGSNCASRASRRRSKMSRRLTGAYLSRLRDEQVRPLSRRNSLII